MSKNNGLPKGITIRKHNQSEVIQIFFMYRNVRCREIIPLPPTKDNIRRAELKRNVILAEIEAKTFKYAEHFPDSTKLKLFCDEVQNVKIGELLENYLNDYQQMYDKGNLSPSTLNNNIKTTNILSRFFKDININELTPQHIKSFIEECGKDNLSIETIRTRLQYLKGLIKDAMTNELLDNNPFDKLSLTKELNKYGKKTIDKVDPFNESEKELIINATSGQLKNMIQFNFWAGLRLSELIALKWEDIDFKTGIIDIQRAKVEYEIKETKTKAGIRKLVMLPKAREALLLQQELTKDSEFVFHNPHTNQPWGHSDSIGCYWRKIVKCLGIKYRNPNQMRHTYVSTLLSNGENVFWLATQLGHKNPSMIFKHYGKYIVNATGYNFAGNY